MCPPESHNNANIYVLLWHGCMHGNNVRHSSIHDVYELTHQTEVWRAWIDIKCHR